MLNPIIIFGSSKSEGNTRKIVESIVASHNIPLIDLNSLQISIFDYEHKNQNDDYIPLMERIIKNHELIVLVTPTYWYTMSATMKIFLDRLSDLLSIRKDLGRKMRGKKLFVITSFGTSKPRGFEDAFSQTCEYMGMEYLGCSYIYTGKDLGLPKNNEAEIEKARKVMLG